MFTELQRRVLLDLLDEENSRDRRTHSAGRTTETTWKEQDALYMEIRRILVTTPLAPIPPPVPSKQD